MSDMKCPCCNEELKPIIGACEDTEYYCQNCDYMTGDENLWNQLTKYKQVLDVATGFIKGISQTVINDCDNQYVVLGNFKKFAQDTLQQITALEQKDIK